MQYCRYQGKGKTCIHPINKNKDGIVYGCNDLFKESDGTKEYVKWLEENGETE